MSESNSNSISPSPVKEESIRKSKAVQVIKKANIQWKVNPNQNQTNHYNQNHISSKIVDTNSNVYQIENVSTQHPIFQRLHQRIEFYSKFRGHYDNNETKANSIQNSVHSVSSMQNDNVPHQQLNVINAKPKFDLSNIDEILARKEEALNLQNSNNVPANSFTQRRGSVSEARQNLEKLTSMEQFGL